MSDWRESAACNNMPVEWFFPEQGANINRGAVAACSSCPVFDSCRDFSIETKQEFGYWAGLSEQSRKQVLKTATHGLRGKGAA